MSATPREIGTLIVVVIRANHLPNKRHIGKQDPYCAVTLNGERRRTKAIKRGGQHPEWDEEIRFTLFEDVDDVLARTAKGDGTPPPPPPKDNGQKKIKGSKVMKLACFADDPREPELIGETDVDLTEVLTKGETDEWFTLENKDKFAGKVYLELTFWFKERPPQKKATPKPPKNSKQYAGPGSFVPAGDGQSPSRTTSTGTPHSRQGSDILPSSMRSSSSAGRDLYVPPYERNQNSQMDGLAQEFSDFGVSQPQRRRESFPPVPSNYPQTSPYGGGYSTSTIYSPHGYEPSLADSSSTYPYDQSHTTHRHSSLHYPHPAPSAVQYLPYQQPGYEQPSTINYYPPARGPRHSVPTASSGFMPLTQQLGFMPLQSHASEPSGFAPPPSQTPAPAGFNTQFHSPQNAYPPTVSHTPIPPANGAYLQNSTFHTQQSFQPSQSYDYSSFGISASASAPPQQYISSPPQASYSGQSNSAPPQIYPLPPPNEAPQGQTPPYANGQNSRPLPQQPQVMYMQTPVEQQLPVQQSQVIQTSHSLPQPPPPANTFMPAQTGNNYPTSNSYSSIPPPPPPPLQHNAGGSNINLNGAQIAVPPPPPLLPSSTDAQPRRRASLPQPPVTYQQPVYQQQPLPPPPPPPMEYYNHNQLPPPPPPLSLDASLNSQNTMYHNGSNTLPKPPIPVDEHGQWIQSANGYPSQAY